jgi:hypothetical protein
MRMNSRKAITNGHHLVHVGQVVSTDAVPQSTETTVEASLELQVVSESGDECH